MNEELPSSSGFSYFLASKEDNIDLTELDPSYSVREDVYPELWAEIDRRKYTEQPWRIRGLVPKAGTTILASISGEKKTWIAMEMAKCITTGENFLDTEKFEVEPCNVLYLNCENPWNEMQRRGRQLGFSDTKDHKLYIVNADSINLNRKEGVAWLYALIEYYKIGAVFIDTFRSVAGALKEEKAEEVRQFFNAFGKLKNQGVSIIWLDHHRKPSNLDGKVPKKEHLLGSQDKTASVEVLLMLRSEAGSDQINLYQRKNRLASELPPFQVLMKDQEGETGRRTLLTYNGDLEEQESKKDEAKELIMEILESGERTTKQILELTRKQVGSKNTRAALAELVAEQLIDLAKRHRENLYFLVREVENPMNSQDLKEADDLFDST